MNAGSQKQFGQQWAQVYDAFDLFLNCAENVALVRQEQGDEPVRVLPEIIRKEFKSNFEISDNENELHSKYNFAIYFDVPGTILNSLCISPISHDFFILLVMKMLQREPAALRLHAFVELILFIWIFL